MIENFPVTGVNIAHFWLSAFAGFAFVFGYDFAFHGILLSEQYQATAHLWRAPEEMKMYFPVAMASQFAYALMLAFVFTRNYEGKGLKEGLRFGLTLGALIGVAQFGIYPYMPISFALAVLWFCGTVIQVVGLGIIFSIIYRK